MYATGVNLLSVLHCLVGYCKANPDEASSKYAGGSCKLDVGHSWLGQKSRSLGGDLDVTTLLHMHFLHPSRASSACYLRPLLELFLKPVKIARALGFLMSSWSTTSVSSRRSWTLHHLCGCWYGQCLPSQSAPRYGLNP